MKVNNTTVDFGFKPMNRVKGTVLAAAITVLMAVGIDYVLLPAYNLHNIAMYFYLAFYLFAFNSMVYIFTQRKNKFTPILWTIVGGLIVFVVVMSLLGSEFLNAERFRTQIKLTEQTDFSDNFDVISLSDIPVVDKETAAQLGDKQIGKVQGLGSQFDINLDYTLISAQNHIYRVSALEYQSIFKWFENRSTGVPGFVQVNVRDSGDVNLVQLNKGMVYVPSAFFDQDLLRHVRFKYRTEILSDFSFELDDNGQPFYVISIIEPKIGFFSGYDAIGVIVVNPVTGEMNKYDLDNIPAWVDRVQPAEIAWAQIDNWGYYIHGWLNTIFGQKDMLQTTSGYNYVSINNSTYVFSGMTSVGADSSIVGFALINLRTKEAEFYKIGGADETSAMSSAEGQVQHLGYVATFPILLNIEGQASYFMSLKDQEGLIKMYSFVNVSDYSVVGVGNSVIEAQIDYITKLKAQGIITGPVSTIKTLTGKITSITTAILNGNSNYYLTIEGQDTLYIANLSLSSELPLSKVGDTVTVTHLNSTEKSLVLSAFDNIDLSY